jgi:hypothetical protein
MAAGSSGIVTRPADAQIGLGEAARADHIRAATDGVAMMRSTLRCLLLASCALASITTHAGSREQAKRLHDRLAGTPPTAAVLDAMAADIAAGKAIDAAFRAMESTAFYNVTLKNFATPWTNREQTVFAPLNDYTATVIGMVRDDVPFNTLLSADLVYVGGPGAGVPAYAATGNEHYEQLEARGADLKQVLVASTQSALTGLPPQATAGVMTTRAAAQAFFIDGTNRAMFRFTAMNHLCRDLEQLHDTSRPPDRIRQDVSRSPGGDSRIFLNNCIGCHNGMDPIVQAFAFYDFDETVNRLVYTEGVVQPKYFVNADNFRPGYVTQDDRWDNYWRAGPNAVLGWGAGPGSGRGAKSLGEELAGSEAFARCQVEKVFRTVCLRPPGNASDRQRVDAMVVSFRGNGYRMKRVFAETAVHCMGQ